MKNHVVCLVSLLLGVVSMPHAHANDGFEWMTIGDPGNKNADPSRYIVPGAHPNAAGRVDYEFQMSRLEINRAQWSEFLNDYWVYRDINANDLRGPGIRVDNFDAQPGEDPLVRVVGGTETWETEMSFEAALRYVNWLHNGKVSEPWAFTTGAYTITDDTPVPFEREADARYWIPNVNEWMKAVYYDPDRYGEGLGGYWTYPNGSDTEPFVGPPDQGGETNLGQRQGPLGQYPDQQSPWGLLDTSGGAQEWVINDSGVPNEPYLGMGSRSGSILSNFNDHIGYFNDAYSPTYSTNISIRLARAVPSGSTSVVLTLSLAAATRRRRDS